MCLNNTGHCPTSPHVLMDQAPTPCTAHPHLMCRWCYTPPRRPLPNATTPPAYRCTCTCIPRTFPHSPTGSAMHSCSCRNWPMHCLIPSCGRRCFTWRQSCTCTCTPWTPTWRLAKSVGTRGCQHCRPGFRVGLGFTDWQPAQGWPLVQT